MGNFKTEGKLKGYLWTLVVALMLGTSVAAGAQVPKFGATAGVNFATVYSANVLGLSNKTGMIFGGFMSYDVIGPLSIQPEVLFSMKGYKASFYLGNQGQRDITIGLNYVEVPILAKVDIPFLPISPLSFNVFAGPDFAYRVGVNSEFTLNGQTTSTSDQISVATGRFDFNVVVGGGFGLPVGPSTLGLDVRYTFATGSINKSGAGPRNAVLSVMASLAF